MSEDKDSTIETTVRDAQNQGVVENLVTQFSNALDCFRELVQNSIDAGSPTIDVWTEFELSEGHAGTISLHIDDYGEGMDEAIIDKQLTQLFSSNKENDLTKIGKFGIGFISVFALEPEAVLVHTGRGGEYWEVLFHEDRTFDKSTLDYPIEGTQVTIFLEGDPARYRELVSGIRATLKRWCCYAETEITFEDRTPPAGEEPELEIINEEFTVDGICFIESEHEDGTRFVMAYSDEPVYGFYNRGLTLAHTNVAEQVFSADVARAMRNVAMKVKSRYLEHTLSRDTIVRDHNYRKAIGMLEESRQVLVQNLVSHIEELVNQDRHWDLKQMNLYGTYISYLSVEPAHMLPGILKRRIFRGLHGGAYTASELWDHHHTDGRILIAAEPTVLTESIQKHGTPVVYGQKGTQDAAFDMAFLNHPLDGVGMLLARFADMASKTNLWGKIRHWYYGGLSSRIRAALASPDDVYLPVKVEFNASEEETALLADARRILEKINSGFKKLHVFEPTRPEAPFFVTARNLSEYMAIPAPGEAASLEAAVNRKHPHFERLLKLHASDPDFAAYCMAKSLLLHDDKLLNRDVGLIQAARDLTA